MDLTFLSNYFVPVIIGICLCPVSYTHLTLPTIA